MNIMLPEIVNLLQNFMWPFVRVSVVMIAAPLFGLEAINLRIRIAIGFVLTWMIFPLVEVPAIDPLSIFAVQLMINEILVGILMGLTLQIVVAAIVTSGQVVSSSMGLGMANMVDPTCQFLNFSKILCLSCQCQQLFGLKLIIFQEYLNL